MGGASESFGGRLDPAGLCARPGVAFPLSALRFSQPRCSCPGASARCPVPSPHHSPSQTSLSSSVPASLNTGRSSRWLRLHVGSERSVRTRRGLTKVPLGPADRRPKSPERGRRAQHSQLRSAPLVSPGPSEWPLQLRPSVRRRSGMPGPEIRSHFALGES